METFSALLAICAGNSPVTVNSPHKGQWRGALMFSLICAWMNGLVNNREAGDLRRHPSHYDVTVMKFISANVDCNMDFSWWKVVSCHEFGTFSLECLSKEQTLGHSVYNSRWWITHQIHTGLRPMCHLFINLNYEVLRRQPRSLYMTDENIHQ